MVMNARISTKDNNMHNIDANDALKSSYNDKLCEKCVLSLFLLTEKYIFKSAKGKIVQE